MKISHLALVASIFAALPLASSASEVPATTEAFSFHHDAILGTSLDLKFVAPSAGAAARAESVALKEIERLRRVLSSWDNSSEVSQLFTTGSLKHPSPELVAVLNQYAAWHALSGSAYSARVGELTSLWQNAAAKGVLPDPTLLATTVQQVAKPAWRIDPLSGTITALTAQRIDLNSLGKGFIIDQALRAVRDSVAGLRGALINVGGDIHVWGQAPNANGWRIAVADPRHASENAAPLTRLALTHGAVSTSGDYQRGFDIAGRHYSHIFDPRTGYPVDEVIGVTVIAADNASANALATTLSVLSPEEGLRLVQQVPGAEAMLETASGTLMRTPGFAAYEEPAPSAAALPTAAIFTASIAFDLTPTERNGHRPYMALWITDTAGHQIRTIAYWGDKPKYQKELSKWWTANHDDAALIDAVTRATRTVGKYTLDWDGLDQKGAAAPAGPYLFWLEAGFEDGPHSAKSTMVVCGPAHATGSIPQASAFAGGEVTCDPVKP